MKVLILGGSSGLGLELARLLKNENEVFITGRTDPKEDVVKFFQLNVYPGIFKLDHLDGLLNLVGQIDLVIYSIGFSQNGKMENLSDLEISNTINSKLTVPSL